MKYQHIWPHTTIWKRRSFKTRLMLFRTQWALIRLAESLTFIHGGLNENLFQYKRNSVAACKKFEAHKKFFYLFHLYVNSLFVLTSFSLNLLTQNSVPSGKTVPKHARKLYEALKVCIYIYIYIYIYTYIFWKQQKFWLTRFSRQTKASKHKTDCVFYQPLRTTYIQTNWTISMTGRKMRAL